MTPCPCWRYFIAKPVYFWLATEAWFQLNCINWSQIPNRTAREFWLQANLLEQYR